MSEDSKKRLYYVNIAIGIKSETGKKNRSTSTGIYVAAENQEVARREALASAVYSICDKPQGTMIITIVATHEISKEQAEQILKDFAHARPQVEIVADSQ